MTELTLMDSVNKVNCEVSKLKESIPQIINSEVLHAFKFYVSSQRDLTAMKEENRKLAAEAKRWKNKCESAESELRLEKQINHESQGKIGGLKEQLSLEVKYCAQLGSSSCNLLWSLSKSGIPHSTLNTTCMTKFLETVEQTLINFSHAESKVSPDSDEMRLVEALCGTLTNISATDEGRDYLLGNGRSGISSVISLLPALSNSSSVLRLLLMFLYNISIHYIGLDILTEELNRRDLDTLITKSRDCQVVLSSLRLLNSVFSENSEGEPTLGLTQESVLLCLSHQNLDIRGYARKLFGKVSNPHEQ